MTDVPYMQKTIVRFSVQAHSGLYTFKAPSWWQPVGLTMSDDANPLMSIYAEVEVLNSRPDTERTIVIYQTEEMQDQHHDEIFIGMIKHPYAGQLFVYERGSSHGT